VKFVLNDLLPSSLILPPGPQYFARNILMVLGASRALGPVFTIQIKTSEIIWQHSQNMQARHNFYPILLTTNEIRIALSVMNAEACLKRATRHCNIIY
jgi:hypothetical protein